MSKKRILHLITGLDVGGAETMLLKTLPLLQDDFDNRVCCIRGHGPIGKQLGAKGIPISYLDLRHPADIAAIFRFRKIIGDFKPDLLVTYLIHSDLFGRIFGRLFGIKKILCNRRGFYLNWKSLRLIDRITGRLASGYIAQTRHAKETLARDLHIPPKLISVIPNAIDFDRIQAPIDPAGIRATFDIPPSHILFVCVSTLKPGKGLDELLEAFARIHTGIPSIALLLIGDGPLRETLETKARHLAAYPAIHFLGHRDDVHDILQTSDIFVLPTYSEGMSNAILEAMQCHLPIITTNIEVNQEILSHDKSGLLVPVRNVDALATAMHRLALEPDTCHRLGAAAYETARQSFDINSVIAMIRETYTSYLK